jgi:hypothetical protein
MGDATNVGGMLLPASLGGVRDVVQAGAPWEGLLMTFLSSEFWQEPAPWILGVGRIHPQVITVPLLPLICWEHAVYVLVADEAAEVAEIWQPFIGH